MRDTECRSRNRDRNAGARRPFIETALVPQSQSGDALFTFLDNRPTPFEADKKGHSVDRDVRELVVDRLNCKLKWKH